MNSKPMSSPFLNKIDNDRLLQKIEYGKKKFEYITFEGIDQISCRLMSGLVSRQRISHVECQSNLMRFKGHNSPM